MRSIIIFLGMTYFAHSKEVIKIGYHYNKNSNDTHYLEFYPVEWIKILIDGTNCSN